MRRDRARENRGPTGKRAVVRSSGALSGQIIFCGDDFPRAGAWAMEWLRRWRVGSAGRVSAWSPDL